MTVDILIVKVHDSNDNKLYGNTETKCNIHSTVQDS